MSLVLFTRVLSRSLCSASSIGHDIMKCMVASLSCALYSLQNGSPISLGAESRITMST